MRKIILQEFVTIDGYAAGPQGELDFADAITDVKKDLMTKDAKDLFKSIDTMILGENTYKMFSQYWPYATTDKEPLADEVNALSKVVFSSRRKTAPWGTWEAGSFFSLKINVSV